MLDVKRMRVLKEVAAQRSFSAAAEKLGYTQSAVSQQIAALEREAGSVLIERNPRGPHSQACHSTETSSDFMLPGGTLIRSRLTRPSVTASRWAQMASICQLWT